MKSRIWVNTCFIWHIMDQAQKLGDHILYVYDNSIDAKIFSILSHILKKVKNGINFIDYFYANAYP